MKSFFANLFIVFGLILLVSASYFLWQRYNPKRLSFNISNLTTQKVNGQDSRPQAVAILIEDLNIKLPIFPAKLENGKWEATTKGVSYLVDSPLPGETGNSILYGHNWPSILGSLSLAKPGQEIVILYSDGTNARFTIKYTQVVTPDQTEILAPTADSRLTLYTCVGFADSKRLVVVAKRI